MWFPKTCLLVPVRLFLGHFIPCTLTFPLPGQCAHHEAPSAGNQSKGGLEQSSWLIPPDISRKYLFEGNIAICSNMSGPRDYDAKRSQIEKDKYHMTSLICGT